MASLSEIRQAMCDVIEQYTTAELFAYKYVDELANLPAVIVEPITADYEMSMARGTEEWHFNVYVLVSRAAGSDDGQELLDQLISGDGPNSIAKILWEHSDLGLPDRLDASVKAMKGYGGAFDFGNVPHVGAVLLVTVITDGRD